MTDNTEQYGTGPHFYAALAAAKQFNAIVAAKLASDNTNHPNSALQLLYTYERKEWTAATKYKEPINETEQKIEEHQLKSNP